MIQAVTQAVLAQLKNIDKSSNASRTSSNPTPTTGSKTPKKSTAVSKTPNKLTPTGSKTPNKVSITKTSSIKRRIIEEDLSHVLAYWIDDKKYTVVNRIKVECKEGKYLN